MQTTLSPEPTRAQYARLAHLRAIMEREQSVNVPDEQDMHLGHSCLSSEESPEAQTAF